MVGLLETPTEPVGPIAADAKGAAAMKRIKRLERPSKVALEAEVNKVVKEIEKQQTLCQNIKASIENRQQNKQAVYGELQQAKNGMSDLAAALRSIQDEKRALRDELDHADKIRERMRADARSLRDKLPYVRVEQIDEEIKKLEYRMTHTSLTLQEEKKFMQQVKDLTKSRDFVKDYNDRLEQINQDETSRADLLQKIREKDAILNDVRAQQELQRKLVAEIREKEASQAADIPALIDQRNVAVEKIKALREEIKELRANFRTREEEYREREKLWKEQQAIQRRKDFEKREAERKERERIRKQRELENFVEPFTNEIIMVEQLTSYLQKYVPAVEESVSSTALKAEIVAPKGVGNILVSKKNKFEEETDSWFSGKVKGKKLKVPAAPKDKSKEKISLSLDALTSFQTVKLSPPTTVGDVIKSIEELKVKKEEFERLQKEAREIRERGEKIVSSKREPKEEDPDETEEESTAEQSSLEAENREENEEAEGQKVVVDSEKNEAECVEGDFESRQNVEGLEPKLPPGIETELPEDLEETQLSQDLSTNLPEDLEAKLAEDLEAKLPEDLESKLPEDLDPKLPEDLEGKQPRDVEAKLPDDLEGQVGIDSVTENT